MLCNGCKREVEDDSTFCEYCGEKLKKEPDNLFCSSCGNNIENGSLFCKHCGAPIGNTVIVPENDNKVNKTNYMPKTIIIALVVAIGLFAFYYYKNTNTGVSVVDNNNDDVNIVVNGDDISGNNSDENDTNKAKEINGIYYTIVDNALYLSGEGTADIKTINSFSKSDFDKVIFESGSIDIPDDAFSGFSNIKSIEFRNYVKKIGARAFKGCGFENIAIGKSITEIGEEAFADCSISVVFLNNPLIRKNLNQRTDFGRLFEFASIIAIYYDDELLLDESSWGQYLKNNKEYSNIQAYASGAKSLSMQNYNLWANAVRPGFYHFCYTTGLEPEGNGLLIDGLSIKDYNGETNTFTFE